MKSIFGRWNYPLEVGLAAPRAVPNSTVSLHAMPNRRTQGVYPNSAQPKSKRCNATVRKRMRNHAISPQWETTEYPLQCATAEYPRSVQMQSSLRCSCSEYPGSAPKFALPKAPGIQFAVAQPPNFIPAALNPEVRALATPNRRISEFPAAPKPKYPSRSLQCPTSRYPALERHKPAQHLEVHC